MATAGVIQFNPTPAQKTSGLWHLAYEIRALLDGLAHNANPSPADRRAIDNMAVEVILLHTRVLRDVFEGQGRHKGRFIVNGRKQETVLSSDFGFGLRAITLVSQYRDLLNTHLAHLSYVRGSIVWEFGKVTKPVLQRCKEFADYLLEASPILASDHSLQREWPQVRQLLTDATK